MEIDEKIQYAIENTRVIKPPRQSLSTFGSTNIYYYLITQLMETANVVREGRVIAAKPKIVTPAYLINLDGFGGGARRYIEMMAEKNPSEPGIFYSYKNEPGDMNIVSEPAEQILEKIEQRIASHGDPLTAIIKGVEEMWDVSLLKFTFELTQSSVYNNVYEMQRSGLFRMDNRGLPEDARQYIEELFEKTTGDTSYASMLVKELKRWGVFADYQDRFFRLFRK
ncbi:MAG TPA: hypothetical protein VJ488_05415 [Dehalococcoidia bacterium]|nr:hypothetical protein [Dehalococcoidia bacterium]